MLNGDIFIKFLPSRLRDLCRRESRKIVRLRGLIHIWSQKLWHHTQDLQKFKPAKISAWRTGSGHKVPPLSKSLYLPPAGRVFSNAGLLLRSAWPTQNELRVFLCAFVVVVIVMAWWLLSFLSLFHLFVLRERSWSYVGREMGRIWEDLGEGKEYVQIYCMSFF